MTNREAAEAMREVAALFVLNARGALGSVNLAEAIMALPLPDVEPADPAAFHRGAEAMREMAAKIADNLGGCQSDCGMDGKAAVAIRALPLPLPEAPPVRDDAHVFVPPHIRKRMENYLRVHDELAAGKSWDEIDNGTTERNWPYDGWLAYMSQTFINAWKSAIIEADRTPVRDDATAVSEVLLDTAVARAKSAEQDWANREADVMRLTVQCEDAERDASTLRADLARAEATIARLTAKATMEEGAIVGLYPEPFDALIGRRLAQEPTP